MDSREYGSETGLYGHRGDGSWAPEQNVSTLLGYTRPLWAVGIGSLARTVTLTPFTPGSFGSFYVDALNQGVTASCIPHAMIGAIYTRLAAIGTPIACPSPQANYTLARCLERRALQLSAVDAPVTMPLLDVGTEPFWSLLALSEYGCPVWSAWGPTFPITPAHVNDEPTDDQMQIVAKLRDFELRQVYGFSDQYDHRAIEVMCALAANHPVVLSFKVDGRFEKLPEPYLVPPAMGAMWNHAAYVVGYTWNGRDLDSLRLQCMNSFGIDWGEWGTFWGDLGFLTRAFDLCVLDVERVLRGPSA